MGYSLGKEDLKLIPLMTSSLSEMVGTMFLVIIGCGTAMQTTDTSTISLAFGLAVVATVSCTARVSGGHLNPAVSVGLLAGGKLSLLKCFLYLTSQCAGSVLGAAVLYLVTPPGDRGTLGSNSLGKDVSAGAGLLMEMIITMLLVMVVYATAVDTSNNTSPMLAPVTIGMTVTAANLVLMPFTGTSINPKTKINFINKSKIKVPYL